MNCAKPKAPLFVLFPALSLTLLVLMTGPGEAVPKSSAACGADLRTCSSKCANKYLECLDSGQTGCKARETFCSDNCDRAWKDCVEDAEIAPKVPKTKVQPKVKPGGAEQPGTESPGVRPKGGVQRY